MTFTPVRSYPLWAAVVLTACAASPTHGAAMPPPAAVAWHGVVTFEARDPTPHGASAALAVRPARWVDVEARTPDGTVVGHTATDDQGRFTLAAPGTATELAVRAHAVWNGHDVGVSPDHTGRGYHTLRVPLGAPGQPITVAATDASPGGPAGAFHIVDTVMQGVEAARLWTGQTLPPLWVWWGRGITTRWSYYRGEVPAHSGRYELELLGGSPGQQQSTDTDEHDEAIILHEVGHFVFDMLSTSTSIGGMHRQGALLDPGLAWEEGRASWFGTAVRASPQYQDTIGVEPAGSLRVDRNVEQPPEGPRGNGGELTVTQVLWELSDGADGLPDTDHDGVALGPGPVLRAMAAARTQPGAYPCLASFLRDLVDQGTVGSAELSHLLDVAGEPQSVLPASATAVGWPLDLGPLPATVAGKIDGLSNPAPAGGEARPENGMDAVRAYRFQLTARSFVMARLRIEGHGDRTDHTDLSLELRSQRADVVRSAHDPGPRHALAAVLEPGTWLVYVRDGGDGNRAGYTLEVTARPVPSP